MSCSHGILECFHCANDQREAFEQGRRAERADTIAYVKRMLTMMGRGHGLARDLEHGHHINAAKTDEPHLGAAGKGGA
jgi:hypothetical protein